jgi:zinc transporter, ZIP family
MPYGISETMVSFADTLLLSAVMGLSIYLSLPIILSKNVGQTRTKLLNAVAIGILIFLIGDVFSDAAGSLYNNSLFGYGSLPIPDMTFTLSFAGGFLALFFFGYKRKIALTQTELALIIALGIAFQNLTEGLLFGSLGVRIGLTGVVLVVLIGFIFQNVTEGFPIASPFLGQMEGKSVVMAGVLLVGGLPTILGGAIGYYYHSSIFDLIFDGLAVGTMLYVILPMLRSLLKESDAARVSIAYVGIFLGFILGFVVNLL